MTKTCFITIDPNQTVRQVIEHIIQNNDLDHDYTDVFLRKSKYVRENMDYNKTIKFYNIQEGSTLLLAGSGKIDSKNDKYPTPGMPLPSKKVEGNSRLWCSIIYLCNERTKELLNEINNIETIKDYYGHGILETICMTNTPANIFYRENIELYDERLLTLIDCLDQDKLNVLFDDCISNKNGFRRKIVQIFESINDNIDNSYYLIALWNCGLKYDDECLEHVKNNKLKWIFAKTMNQNCEFKNKYKLLNEECPITLTKIEIPAITPDGTMYEYNAIKQWLERNDTNPIDNSMMERHYQLINGDYRMSNKILYLPITNTFEHFKFVK